MTRLLAINLWRPDGAQVPAGTPIAVRVWSDAPPEERPYYSGLVEEDGRLLLRFDGDDPHMGGGINVEVLAVPDCATWTGRGTIQGNEFLVDAIGGIACDPVPGIQLREGDNPFA